MLVTLKIQHLLPNVHQLRFQFITSRDVLDTQAYTHITRNRQAPAIYLAIGA